MFEGKDSLAFPSNAFGTGTSSWKKYRNQQMVAVNVRCLRHGFTQFLFWSSMSELQLAVRLLHWGLQKNGHVLAETTCDKLGYKHSFGLFQTQESRLQKAKAIGCDWLLSKLFPSSQWAPLVVSHPQTRKSAVLTIEFLLEVNMEQARLTGAFSTSIGKPKAPISSFSQLQDQDILPLCHGPACWVAWKNQALAIEPPFQIVISSLGSYHLLSFVPGMDPNSMPPSYEPMLPEGWTMIILTVVISSIAFKTNTFSLQTVPGRKVWTESRSSFSCPVPNTSDSCMMQMSFLADFAWIRFSRKNNHERSIKWISPFCMSCWFFTNQASRAIFMCTCGMVHSGLLWHLNICEPLSFWQTRNILLDSPTEDFWSVLKFPRTPESLTLQVGNPLKPMKTRGGFKSTGPGQLDVGLRRSQRSLEAEQNSTKFPADEALTWLVHNDPSPYVLHHSEDPINKSIGWMKSPRTFFYHIRVTVLLAM